MSEKIMRDNFVVLAQAYADATGLALATVSKRIHGKHTFLDNFIAGRASTTLVTYYAMVEKMRATWPKGAKWPATRTVPKLMRTEINDAVRTERAKKMPKRSESGRFVRKPSKRGNSDGARS